VIDHCSFSWAVDETLTVCSSRTTSPCSTALLAEPLFHSKHPEGPHSMGILDRQGRRQRLAPPQPAREQQRQEPAGRGRGRRRRRNNVMYNWGEYAALFKGPNNRINFVDNYYKKGPDSEHAWTKSTIKVQDDAQDMKLFVAGNVDPTLPRPTATTGRWSSG
jgi:hypothetical protein